MIRLLGTMFKVHAAASYGYGCAVPQKFPLVYDFTITDNMSKHCPRCNAAKIWTEIGWMCPLCDCVITSTLPPSGDE